LAADKCQKSFGQFNGVM
jgi:hypothetical protein